MEENTPITEPTQPTEPTIPIEPTESFDYKSYLITLQRHEKNNEVNTTLITKLKKENEFLKSEYDKLKTLIVEGQKTNQSKIAEEPYSSYQILMKGQNR